MSIVRRMSDLYQYFDKEVYLLLSDESSGKIKNKQLSHIESFLN